MVNLRRAWRHPFLSYLANRFYQCLLVFGDMRHSHIDVAPLLLPVIVHASL